MARGLRMPGALAAGSLLLIAGALGLAGCATWQIEPPAELKEPEEIWLTRYDRHVRLALPSADRSRVIEYGFGDWHWYARQETGAWSGLRALFLPGDAALSRREIPLSPSGDAPAPWGGRRESMPVEAARVDALRDALEAQWEALQGAETTRHRGSIYRRTDEAYHLFNTSNAKTAEWLRTLDCRIRGLTIGGDFEVSRGAPHATQNDSSETPAPPPSSTHPP